MLVLDVRLARELAAPPGPGASHLPDGHGTAAASAMPPTLRRRRRRGECVVVLRRCGGAPTWRLLRQRGQELWLGEARRHRPLLQDRNVIPFRLRRSTVEPNKTPEENSRTGWVIFFVPQVNHTCSGIKEMIM